MEDTQLQSMEGVETLEGRFVEVFDMEYRYARTLADREKDRKLINVNGRHGRCAEFLEKDNAYAVQILEGQWVCVPQEFLREIEVPQPEDGGFDLVWPSDDQNFEDMEYFGELAAACLARKGYCMIQTFTCPEERNQATEAAEQCPNLQGSLRREIESAYLGADNTTQMCAVGTDDGNQAIDADDHLARFQRQFTNFWIGFAPHANPYLGFTSNGWSSVWARPYDENVGTAKSFDGGDESVLENYDQFLAGRTVCALHMLDNEGGEIRLATRSGDMQETILPVKTSRMLLFRHDLMSYSYVPIGESMALQCWLMAAEKMEVSLQSSIVAKLTGVRGPPEGKQAQIMSSHTRFPGNVDFSAEFWNMFVGGTDTDIQWPTLRWETEAYYTDTDQWAALFKSYTKHGAFMEQEHIENFDNKFFGLGETESQIMCPGQRLVMEVGYVALMQGGHTRATLNGENIGVFLGDVGMDWHAAAGGWSYTNFGAAAPHVINDGLHVSVTANRMSHNLNLLGPTLTVDTACSASLVALQAGHKQMMHYDTDANKRGSVTAPHAINSGGVNTLLTPTSFVGNCMASMLSHVGRCWTFDRTADGYQRGEGCAFMFVKWSADEIDMEERLACLIGTCANHDGRSASLTAPNGPSQQQCIRKSMQMADLDPSKISIAECHGTGTALGDPIEVGALQGVMRGMREFPLFNTSAKTNISHLEAAAGIAGITKCVMLVISSCAPPNCSLRVLNPNLESTMQDGYPVYFEQELSDCAFTTTCLGVSSFGFGGTNSRADIYGRCLRGPRSTGNIWTAERIETRAEAYKYGLRNSYKGVLDDEHIPDRNICIVGTWNAYSEMEVMTCSTPGVHTCTVTIGDTRWEQFQVLVNGDSSRQLYPAADHANAAAIIMGPDEHSNSRQWLIHGRDQGVTSGTTYQITFEWRGKFKSMSWDLDSSSDGGKRQYAHRYDILNPVSGEVHEMELISQEDGLYEGVLFIDNPHGVHFQFIRDQDRDQLIYPASPKCADTAVPVRGPDAHGQNLHWLAHGDYRDTIKVQLRVMNGKISVTLLSAIGDSHVWQSHVEPAYYVSGTFNNWKNTVMVPDKRVYGLFRHHVRMGDSNMEEFQVMLDSDGTGEMSQIVRPEALDEPWHMEGEAGSTWEVLLDLNQDEAGRRVYWRKSIAREQHLVGS